MYPDLSYVFHELVGSQADNWTSVFKTFGAFFALAVLVSAWLLRLELIRKEKESLIPLIHHTVVIGKPASFSDLVLSASIGFIIGFKLIYVVFNFNEFKHDPQVVLLSTKGVILGGLIGGLGSAIWKFWQKEKTKLETPVRSTTTIRAHKKLGDITMVALISGLIGAKFFDLVENLDSFFANPIEAIFSGGGLAIYGGLIVGSLTTILYLKKLGLPILPMLDAAAPALILGNLVGRFGCHFAGDGCWGITSGIQPNWWIFPDWLWENTYPRNVIQQGVPIEGCTWNYCMELSQGVYPTPLYEIMMFTLILGVLWSIRKHITTSGMLFFIYLILNGIERYTIEIIRVNQRYDLLGFTFSQAQFVAIGLILIGLIGVLNFNSSN